MATETEQLVVLLEARVNDFEKNMKRAVRASNENFDGIETRARRAAKNLEATMGKAGGRIKPTLDTSELERGTRLSAQQFVILKAAATDAFGGLSGGQSPLTVLTQQAGQVASAIGEDGVMGLLGGVGNGLASLITPARAATVGLAAFGVAAAVAFSRYTEERLATELALTGIGRASGVSTSQITTLGAEIAKTSGISVAAGRDIATSLAATGKLTADNLADVGALAKGYGKLFSTDLATAGKELAAIFGGDLAAGADKLDGRLGFLDDKTRQYVRTLVAQGERQKAINIVVAAARPELLKAAEATSVWAKAWGAVKDGADAAANSVGRAIDRAVTGPSPAERLAQLRAQRDGSENGYVAELRKSGLDDKAIKALVPSYQPDTRGLDEQIKKTEELIDAEERRRKAEAEEKRANEASKMAGEIVRAVNAEAEAIEDLENRYKALGKVMADPAAVAKLEDADKARTSYEELGKRLEELKADYQAGGQAATQALRAANFANATAGLDAYRKGLAAINEKYDEQIRLARQAGDTATTAARVSTLEAARRAETGAYRTEAAERAKASVNLPDGFAGSVIGAESNGNDSAHNSRSTAAGAGQFINGTWLALFKKTFADQAAGMGDEAILAMRSNRETTVALIEAYAKENAVALQNAGFKASSANLQLAHFLGAGGALSMLKADPSVNAAGVLPDAAKANPEVFKRGSASVQDVLDYAERRAQRGSTSGKAQAEHVTALRAEAEAYQASAAQAEKLRSVQEQLDADRERGGELARQFATAGDLIKASSDKLTPALAAQRAEVLALAEARSKAAASGLSTRFDKDMTEARASLGRTDSENAARSTARGYGFDLSTEAGKSAVATAELNANLLETKRVATGAVTGLASDLLRGASAADAMNGALLKIADTIISKLADSLVSGLFSGMGGGGAAGGGLAKLLGFDGGGYTGDGGRLEPAGLVHKGEVVWSQDDVRRWGGARAVDAMRRGYANGGIVGAPSIPATGLAQGGAMSGSQTVTVAPQITIQTNGGGTPEANADLSRRIGSQVEGAMRGVVVDELRRQLRPGALFDRAGR